jgi:glycosyltransferase involved in cell wall biosynthesis
MKQPLVSIIVTSFNQVHCIANTLESIVSQTYTNWECIIVDDGSFDNSAEVIKEFIKDDARFTYLFQDNQGVARARNKGFTLATGSFINFMDGDDTFLSNKLREQINIFQNHSDISICVCDHQFYLEKESVYKYYKFEKLTIKPLEQILFKWNNGVAFPPHAPLYKRSVWEDQEAPFPEDYKYRCEDWVFNVLLALKDVNYYMLDKVLCNYHMADANFTNNTKSLATAAIKAALYLKPKLPKQYQEDFIDKTINNSLDMYLGSQKSKILQESTNWRIANAFSKPFLNIFKY